MDAFVRRLIERLHDPSMPLSRNRHFHTFETPEGRTALKTSRRLKSLQRDLHACLEDGHPASFLRHQTAEGEHRIELQLHKVLGRRTAILTEAEFELLLALPGVQEAFAESGNRAGGKRAGLYIVDVRDPGAAPQVSGAPAPPRGPAVARPG